VQDACWAATYKSKLAYQGVVGPDGIVLDFTGPFAVSKADGSSFIESTLQAVIVAIILGYHSFSDTAYPMSLQGFTGIEATENLHEIACDILMASLRIVIAWIFGCLSKMFPALRSADKLCLGNGNIGTSIAAATILYNAVICLEPNMISQKYACRPPCIKQVLQEKLPMLPSEYKGRDGACLATQADCDLFNSANDHVQHCLEKGRTRT
jgi:hypothetical protein